jgi:hypothetical protein
MHKTRSRRALFPGLLIVTAISAPLLPGGCSPLIKRDLSATPQGQIGFDDMCGLQDYFDSLEAKVAKEPVVLSSLDLEGGDGKTTLRGGKARLVFEGNFLLKHGKRVLYENWQRLPEELATTERFDLEVRWAERAGVRRVVTDQDAELIIGDKSWDLPYHVCLSEWLYGAPLYKQRRVLWGLPDPTTGKPTKEEPLPAPAAAVPADAGAPAVPADSGAAPK